MRRAVVPALLLLVLTLVSCAAVLEEPYAGPPSITPAAPPVPPDTPCTAQFELAAEEAEAELETNVALAETLDACTSRTDWTETARLFPSAVGLDTGETPEVFQIVRELCSSHPDGSICEGINVDAPNPHGTTCDEQFELAAMEGRAGGWSEDELAATLDSCDTRGAWMAVAQRYPDALGMTSVNQDDAEFFLRLMCESYPASAIC